VSGTYSGTNSFDGGRPARGAFIIIDDDDDDDDDNDDASDDG
jgi:hypothetical protein